MGIGDYIGSQHRISGARGANKAGRNGSFACGHDQCTSNGEGDTRVRILDLSMRTKVPVSQRISHTDPAKYDPWKSIHGGAGQLDFMALLGASSLDTNLIFLHRGILQPKGGIGHHFHNQCEEMFFILDGEAEFTIDGRTSMLKAPAGAPCRAGHSHAIYNRSDEPVQWMNINVGLNRGQYDNFDLGDTRVGAPLDAVPVFMTTRLYRDVLQPVSGKNGGKGAVYYRRALPVGVMRGPWAYMDHVLIPPGASVGNHRHAEVAEFYYVMSGRGIVSIGGLYWVMDEQGTLSAGQQMQQCVEIESAPIVSGDAVPIQLNEVHSFENTGSEPLELMIVGIARETSPSGTQLIDEIDVGEGTGSTAH
jgi:mannose-6-phosphate isomerase-like protein (cupin superfamily)